MIIQDPIGSIALGSKIYLKCICTNFFADELMYTWIDMNTGEQLQNQMVLNLTLNVSPIKSLICIIRKKKDNLVKPMVIVHRILVKSRFFSFQLVI